MSLPLEDPEVDIIIINKTVEYSKYNELLFPYSITGNLFTSLRRSLGLYIIGYYV
jgi:hypothetical protein